MDVAATLYNISQTYHQIGNLDESLANYNKFLKIATTVFGPESRDVGLVYTGMAEIYQIMSLMKNGSTPA